MRNKILVLAEGLYQGLECSSKRDTKDLCSDGLLRKYLYHTCESIRLLCKTSLFLEGSLAKQQSYRKWIPAPRLR